MLGIFTLLYIFAAFVQCWDFSPVLSDVYSAAAPILPVPSATQYVNGSAFGSYWSSSFLTGTNGHQYLAISHAFVGSFYRCSILDITDSSYKSWLVGETTTPPSESPFNLSFDGFLMEALSSDNVSTLHTESTNGSSAFNLTFSADHPFLYNFGTGLFLFGEGTTYEWGMPMGRTEGSLTFNDELVTIDPKNSFTWYDRQWGDGFPTTGNWTWYELHLPENVKASIWTWDNASPEQHIRAGTFQYPDGTTKIMTFDWITGSRSWSSPKTNILYPLDWTLVFANGDELQISSTLDDQEIVGASTPEHAYEGFVNVTGSFEGRRVIAYGMVEMVRFIE